MNWAVPAPGRADQFCMTKTMKILLIPVAALAFAGGLAACNGDDTPADPVPTTVVTSDVPDPDEPPVQVSPSTSISVSPSPSVSVSVSDVPDEIPGGNDGDNPQDNRPEH